MSSIGLSVIMPAFNEAGNLRGAIESVMWAAAEADLGAFEIILVDDGSTDGTHDVAMAIGGEGLPLSGFVHEVNRGLRAAYETGLMFAQYEYVTWVPSDNEMDRESLREIFSAIGTADLVIPFHGTPENRPRYRRALTWISTTQLNLLLGHRLNYYQGTVVFPTEMARRLPRTVDGFFFCAEMLAHALEDPSIREVVEVPLEHRERRYGVSKAVSWRAVWRGQVAVLRIWRAVRAARTAPHSARQFAGT